MIDILILSLFFACVLFRDRLFMPVPFVSAELPALEAPLVLAAALLAIYRISFLARAFRSGVLISWLPYVVLGTALPVLGVGLMGYTVTSLYASLAASFLPLSALVIGAAVLPGRYEKRHRLIHWLLNAGLFLQLGLCIIQFLRIMGYSNSLIALVAEWDINSQARFKEEYVIVGRSIGAYINPNVLGLWALGAFFWNLIHGKGMSRSILCVLSLLTLLLSQSRGSVVALFVSLAFYIFRTTMTDRPAKEGLKSVIVTSSVAVIGVITLAFLVPEFSMLPGFERWESGMRVVTSGTEADVNFAGRLAVWRESLSFMRDYPMGTLGPPQVLFILPPDNQYVHLLLQGSVPYVFSFLIGLIASIGLIFRQSKEAVLVAVFAVTVATNSVTALPFLYPPGLLFWFFLGLHLNAEAAQRIGRMKFADEAPPRSERTNEDLGIPGRPSPYSP
jgi:hypothetical protein